MISSITKKVGSSKAEGQGFDIKAKERAMDPKTIQRISVGKDASAVSACENKSRKSWSLCVGVSGNRKHRKKTKNTMYTTRADILRLPAVSML